jgi:hypothetical protein
VRLYSTVPGSFGLWLTRVTIIVVSSGWSWNRVDPVVRHRTRVPASASQWSGLLCFASGASLTWPTEIPYFQSGGQMAMKRA